MNKIKKKQTKWKYYRTREKIRIDQCFREQKNKTRTTKKNVKEYL